MTMGHQELLTCNEEVRARFWYWIRERQSIWYKRFVLEQDKPWTEDKILREYKFTNAFRQLDKGTVWLRENFLHPFGDAADELLVFNVVWYRWFNHWPTGKHLGFLEDWNEEEIRLSLKRRSIAGEQVFTGAHMVYSGRGGGCKIRDICKHITPVWENRHIITKEIKEKQTIEHAFHMLYQFDLLGPFLAYEMATDLRWTKVLKDATDKLTWANPGPGCMRGIRRIWPDATPKTYLSLMRELYDEHEERLGPETLERCPYPFELREVEHSLCEFDKYERTYQGEGRPRTRYQGY